MLGRLDSEEPMTALCDIRPLQDGMTLVTPLTKGVVCTWGDPLLRVDRSSGAHDALEPP